MHTALQMKRHVFEKLNSLSYLLAFEQTHKLRLNAHLSIHLKSFQMKDSMEKLSNPIDNKSPEEKTPQFLHYHF